jgi:hypothetical protein
MNQRKKALAINSILIGISTGIIGTILHELAHYVVAVYFGLNPELHHNYVLPRNEGTPEQHVIMAAAGPLFSFFFGIFALWVSVKFIRPSLLKLATLWLGMGSILTLMGYMLIAPIAKNGDTGRVFDYFGVPMYLSIAIAVASFVAINYLFGKFAKYFIFYKHDEIFDKTETRKQLFIYPIYASIVIMTLLNLPIVTWVSLMPTIFMPMTYFSTDGTYQKMQIADAEVVVNKTSIPLIILIAVCILIFRMLVY